MKEVVNSDKAVLIDFYADWCGPCKMLSPTIEEISRENGDIKVCKVDIDSDPELAQQFRVMSIPTLVAIKDGKVLKTVSGVRSKKDILGMFE
jgi:thioredoxin 1